jgi:6,7-dimethyl-8-ribityllumazine synthase
MKHIKAHDVHSIKPFSLAIISSQFNQDVTSALLQDALQRLTELGFTTDDVTVVEVPGAIEIPIVAKCLAAKKQYEVIISLGAVIRGDTSHYDYVCDLVSRGCQQVSLDYNLPVIFGVLTTENDAQAWDRINGTAGRKGADSVDCALAMYSIMRQL